MRSHGEEGGLEPGGKRGGWLQLENALSRVWRRQVHFEMSCTIGNGMVLVSEMLVLLESASMGEGA